MSPAHSTAIRRRSLSGALVLVALCLACGTAADPEASPGAPVIVVSIDTLRSDRLPAYGYAGIQTPAIDAFRRDAVLFERAFSHVPLTLPSHASIFTGLLPPGHGVRDNLGYRLETRDLPWLPRILRDNGYATGAAISAFVLRGATGFADGFDHYDDEIQVVTGAALGSLQRPGGETLDKALEWVETVREKPFLLFFHIYEPHSPYEPPEPWGSLYDSAYDGEVAAADEVVGRLFARLREMGLYEDALIVLLSDHGEGLMDHGEMEHEILLYRETIQVPLIVKLPENRRAGEAIATPAGLTDVFPTVLTTLGIELPDGLDGRPLLELADLPTDERGIYSETYYPRLHFGWSELASWVQGPHHYIHGPDPELYDVIQDPGETVNILREERRTYASMRDSLETIDRTLQDPSEDDPETRRKLAALGYVGSVSGEASGPLPDPKSRLDVLAELKNAFVDFTSGDFPAATVAFRQVLESEPRMVDAWEHLGKSLQRQGRLEEAQEAFDRAFELSGGAPHVALSMSEIAYQIGDLDSAAKFAELALPAHEMGYDLLARTALRRGDLEEAERQAQLALPGRGTRIGPLVILAQVRLEQERFEDAIRLTRQAAEEFGDRGDSSALAGVFSTQGRALAGLGEVDRAEEAFMEGLRRAPTDLESYTHLAYLFAVADRVPEAGRVLQRMVQVNDNPNGYAAAVRTLRVMGDPGSAAAVLAQARQRWPGAAELEGL